METMKEFNTCYTIHGSFFRTLIFVNEDEIADILFWLYCMFTSLRIIDTIE